MSAVKGKNTKPERIVRSKLHKMGYRFRLHRRDLPGNPDIVLTKYKKIIFVHGCFWHGHEGCPRSKRPAGNEDFWNKKLDKTICRDRKNLSRLREAGWSVLIVWTCELKDMDLLENRLRRFIEC
jgi:DNA mismatch endonuclease (patch repair protein)